MFKTEQNKTKFEDLLQRIEFAAVDRLVLAKLVPRDEFVGVLLCIVDDPDVGLKAGADVDDFADQRAVRRVPEIDGAAAVAVDRVRWQRLMREEARHVVAPQRVQFRYPRLEASSRRKHRVAVDLVRQEEIVPMPTEQHSALYEPAAVLGEILQTAQRTQYRRHAAALRDVLEVREIGKLCVRVALVDAVDGKEAFRRRQQVRIEYLVNRTVQAIREQLIREIIHIQ